MKNLFLSKELLFTATLIVAVINNSFAQLSPPGLGKAKTASWFAFGLKQSLDSTQQKESTTYIGMGRKSGLDESNPMSNLAILVINEEISNHFREHWIYAYALSYRRSNLFEPYAPYEDLDPAIEQEFRAYGRFSYVTGNDGLKWKNTIRQEFRKFYNSDFSNPDETFQLRTRFKTQLNIDLGNQKIHHIIGSAEVLFSISKENYPENKWSKFGYKETRFGLYYSLSPRDIPLVFDLGYMHNIIGQSDVVDVNYVALDIIWKDPFKKW